LEKPAGEWYVFGMTKIIMRFHRAFAAIVAIAPALAAQDAHGLATADLAKLRGLGDVHISPNGAQIAYAVTRNDRPGRPYSEIWIRDVASGAATRLGKDGNGASNPLWSPDGKWIAFFGRVGDSSGVAVAKADGSDARLLATTQGTNSVNPGTGARLTWSPDGKSLAYVGTTPGPEADANGDPMVITRYAYKPTASEGLTRFNDNRRLHIFTVEISSGRVRQLTKGDRNEHSIDWSPSGREIVFASNPQPDPDRDFNYDIFAVNVESGAIRTIIGTRSVEYQPTWSPDGKQLAYLGTKRTLTSSETTMEDTHVWICDADGTHRKELGIAIDDRQGAPKWSPDGNALYSVVGAHGFNELYRIPLDGTKPVKVISKGGVGSWSLDQSGGIAFAFTTPAEPGALHLLETSGVNKTLVSLNTELLAAHTIATVDSITFKAKDGTSVQAFLTLPLGRTAASKHPLIVEIHGGPHGQQGPDFNGKSQVFAAHGYAVLMVNYRGSTGYGQKFADAIFKDQDGKEAEDVISAVDASLKKWPFLDGTRMGIEGGSYGGQLTDWIITRTTRFKAAIPSAGISNLVSFNYMSYYHDYLAVEFGKYPTEGALMDTLWARSALRYTNKVKTPVLFVHGENDNDVPIAEDEQFYIALKDVGVPTNMLRYPREGHGLRETQHVADLIDRSIAWYDRWFTSKIVQ
jgi:dipeptidyl aminopeptidase/acylaminoacyl peptidase